MKGFLVWWEGVKRRMKREENTKTKSTEQSKVDLPLEAYEEMSSGKNKKKGSLTETQQNFPFK